jgi:hypothetical protein
MRNPGWVLVRPDQVVAARGAGADFSALDVYAAQILCPRPDARHWRRSRDRCSILTVGVEVCNSAARGDGYGPVDLRYLPGKGGGIDR